MARTDIVRDMPAGIGFSIAIPPPTPLIDCEGPFAVPPEALTDWVAEAEEGARCVYARVEHGAAVPKRLREKVAELLKQGVLTLYGLRRYRPDSSLYDQIVKRTCMKPPTAAPQVSTSAAVQSYEDRLDDAASLIFDELQRAVRRGVRCPSDLDLAKAAELATRHQAAWRVRRLAREGRIGIETLTGPDGCPWRVVTIGKHRTAPPPQAALPASGGGR